MRPILFQPLWMLQKNYDIFSYGRLVIVTSKNQQKMKIVIQIHIYYSKIHLYSLLFYYMNKRFGFTQTTWEKKITKKQH